MSGPDVQRSPAHERVGVQRGHLRAASRSFQAAVDAPVASRSAWCTGVGAALRELGAAWQEHVQFTETPNGLFDELMEDAVEVAAPEIDHLKRDHAVVAGAIGRATQLLTDPQAGPDDTKLRDSLSGIAKQVESHRRRGAELLYNVYSVDPTGGG
jgi:hypothetical protein